LSSVPWPVSCVPHTAHTECALKPLLQGRRKKDGKHKGWGISEKPRDQPGLTGKAAFKSVTLTCTLCKQRGRSQGGRISCARQRHWGSLFIFKTAIQGFCEDRDRKDELGSEMEGLGRVRMLACNFQNRLCSDGSFSMHTQDIEHRAEYHVSGTDGEPFTQE
jgi:ribosomal protein L44E